MTNFKATITEEQLQFIISLFEKSLQTMALLQPDNAIFDCHAAMGKSEPGGRKMKSTEMSSEHYAVKMRGMSNLSTHSIEHQSSQIKASSSGSDISSSEPLKLGTDIAKSKARLSLWVQWTLPMASISLLASNGQRQRLTITIEDYQSSFDWSAVYFQAKAKVLAAAIKHEVKKLDKWTMGPNQGLVITFGGDEITSELETVNRSS